MSPEACRDELRNSPFIDAIKTAIAEIEDNLERWRGMPNVEERRIGYRLRDGAVDLLGAALLEAEGRAASAMSNRLAKEAEAEAEREAA